MRAGEMVSRQCPARTPLADFFSIRLGFFERVSAVCDRPTGSQRRRD